MLFQTIAYATAGEAPAPGGLEQMIPTLLMLALMVVVFYFLLIRPQRKKDKQAKEMISALSVGDVITTIGGIKGKVSKIKDDELLLETGMVGNPSERATIRLAKWAVRDVVKKAETKQQDDAEWEEEEKSDEQE